MQSLFLTCSGIKRKACEYRCYMIKILTYSNVGLNEETRGSQGAVFKKHI